MIIVLGIAAGAVVTIALFLAAFAQGAAKACAEKCGELEARIRHLERERSIEGEWGAFTRQLAELDGRMGE